MARAHANEDGFTLIELMIVAAVISVMLAIAVPSVVSFISSYRATSAINELLQSVTLTRNEAIKRGRRVTMAPVGGDWRNGWTVFMDSTCGATPQAYDACEELIFQHEPLPASIAVAGPGTNPTPAAYLIFDGTGYPRLAPVSPTSPAVGIAANVGIAVTDTTGSSVNIRTLCVATMGRARIVKGIDPCTAG